MSIMKNVGMKLEETISKVIHGFIIYVILVIVLVAAYALTR